MTSTQIYKLLILFLGVLLSMPTFAGRKKDLHSELDSCYLECQKLDSIHVENLKTIENLTRQVKINQKKAETFRILSSNSPDIFLDPVVKNMTLDPENTAQYLLRHAEAIKAAASLVSQLKDIQDRITELEASGSLSKERIADRITVAIDRYYEEWNTFILNKENVSTFSVEQISFIQSELPERYNIIIEKYF